MRRKAKPPTELEVAEATVIEAGTEVTVRCGHHGPVATTKIYPWAGGYIERRSCCVADLEEFCSIIRAQGGTDVTSIPDAWDLRVTIKRGDPRQR